MDVDVSHSDKDTTERSETEPSKSPTYRVRVGDLGTVELSSCDAGKPHEAIYDEDDASSIDENYDVVSLASTIDDQLTWRGRMQVVLHSNNFHIFIVALIIIDVLIVLVELFLDLGAFGNIVCPFGGDFLEQMEFCHFHKDSRSMCSAPARLVVRNETVCGGLSSQVECMCGFRGGRRVCVPNTEGPGVDPGLLLHGSSLLILTIFMIEIMLKLIAFRLKFFTHKSDVFDGAIIVLSWMYDMASLIEMEAFEAAPASILISLRLWRVVRIVTGSVLSSVTKSNAQLHKAKRGTKRIIHALHKAQDKLEKMEQENGDLKNSLRKAEKQIKLMADEQVSSRPRIRSLSH